MNPLIYDLTYQKGLRPAFPGKELVSKYELIYDLTYQKGLRLKITCGPPKQ